jgi:hypothetical protein
MEILVPLGFFVMIAGIVAISVWGSTQAKREINETIRRAIDSGQKIDSETIMALGKPPRPPQADIRGGIVLLALAVGLSVGGAIASGWIVGLSGWGDDSGTGLFVAAAIVGAIGIGQLIAGFSRITKKGA